MRIISVVLLLVSVALAGCEGGERISKAASAPPPGAGQPSAGAAESPSGDLSCMEKCIAKADDKEAKCLKSNTAEVCDAAQLEDSLRCKDVCVPR